MDILERKYYRKALFLLAIALCSKAKETRKSMNMDPINVSLWNLPTDDQYPLTFELNEKNFQSALLQNEDPWIILFHKGDLNREWLQHAANLKGSVWCGTVNVLTQKQLATEWVPTFVNDEAQKAVYVVFPYGKDDKKKVLHPKSNKRTIPISDAEKLLSSTSPITFRRFAFSDKNIEVFHKWVVDSYYTPPLSKFPLLCLLDTDLIPPVLHTLKVYFNNFFSFGIVMKRDVKLLRRRFKDVPEPQSYPHFLLLLGREPNKKEYDSGKTGLFFDVFPFNEKKYGNPLHFTSLVKFLFTANEDFRKDLPGRRVPEPESVSTMKSVQIALTNRLLFKKEKLTTKSEL